MGEKFRNLKLRLAVHQPGARRGNCETGLLTRRERGILEADPAYEYAEGMRLERTRWAGGSAGGPIIEALDHSIRTRRTVAIPELTQDNAKEKSQAFRWAFFIRDDLVRHTAAAGFTALGNVFYGSDLQRLASV